MNKRNWNEDKIIKEIKENGFYIFENFFSDNDLDKTSVKETNAALLGV